VVGIIAVDLFERDLAFAVIHLGVGHTGFVSTFHENAAVSTAFFLPWIG